MVANLLPPGFRVGVATAGFQVEGGFNGPGEPANNWEVWELTGRAEPSGAAVRFFEDPEPLLDRAAGLGCDSFRLSVEWARVERRDGHVDAAALERYREIVDACLARGLEPLVTVHHFTHPAWLGAEHWLHPDAPARFRRYAERVVEALAPAVRLWVTVNEVNVLALQSWFFGAFPPGRVGAAADAATALGNLLHAHVLAYEAIHEARPDAVVTTNNAGVTVYELDQMLTDLLLARRAGVARQRVSAWCEGRRAVHDRAVPPAGPVERGLRSLARRVVRPDTPALVRAVDAAYASPCECTLDVVGVDHYDPVASRHLQLPGRRTAGGRSGVVRPLWDEIPDPARFGRWLAGVARDAPGRPVWVVENGLCTRVRAGRSYARSDGWTRPAYLRTHLAALVRAVGSGVPVEGYWHWSLVDNYEWGSYEPRFGVFGIDRHHGPGGFRWLETDAAGHDAPGAFRQLVAGLRAGDASVLGSGGVDPLKASTACAETLGER